MSKVAFQMIVYNSDYVLEPCLKAIAPYGEIFVTEGPVEYFVHRGFMTSGDKTNEILRKYVPLSHIVHGQWKEKDEMMNAVAPLIPEDTTHVWMIDSDEIWKSEDIEHVLALLDDWDSVAFKPYSFYGGLLRYMTGFEENFSWQRIQRWYPGAQWETHRPPTIRARDGALWAQHRHLSNVATAEMGLRFYHYSYVFPEQIRTKTEYYHDRDLEGTISDYFRRIYLPWVLGDDKLKAAIEEQWQGVHDWQPGRRGPCFTAAFEGEHPQVIRAAMPKLNKRFQKELRRYRNGRC